MTRTVRDNEITERLLAWVNENYQGWGRFVRLGEESGLPVQHWRELHARRQYATKKMLDFVRRVSPKDADWICAGIPQRILKNSTLESLSGEDRSLVIVALQALCRERTAVYEAACSAFNAAGRKTPNADIFGVTEVEEALRRLSPIQEEQ